MTSVKNQFEQEAAGNKDSTPAPRKKESLLICEQIVGAYKHLVASDEAELQKLTREMTKCFVTASAIISRLNRAK